MKKKIIIISIFVLIIICIVIIIVITKNKNVKDNIDNDVYGTVIYDKNGNVIVEPYNADVTKEITENITIEGIVELHSKGRIYIFNGQHFGEQGIEMEEYTSANIVDKNQKCIDYITLQEYDTSYIQPGDLLICTGDYLKKGDPIYNELDTKDNPIIVLKESDYNKMKLDVLKGNNKYSSSVTIEREEINYGGYNNYGYLFLKYTLEDNNHSNTKYCLPFVVKAYITQDTKIDGDLQDGKSVEVQYEDLTEPFDKLNLKSIKVLEN